MATEYDLHFYFDPVCPFAWMTSKWVRTVAQQRDYRVDWRFISLRIINSHIDYADHFPQDYEQGHTAGLRLLRVAARARAQHGREIVGPLYEAMGTRIFDTPRTDDPLSASDQGARRVLEPLLDRVGLPLALADALDDKALDDEIRAETDEALALTGRDVGTPILHFQPPDGTAFFGPVISRLPPRRSRRVMGPRHRAGGFSRVRRAQAQPARAATAGQLRRRPRRGRASGGLARRQPSHQAVAFAASRSRLDTVHGRQDP